MLDADRFPFQQAELAHQFHDSATGTRFDRKYRALRATRGKGGIHNASYTWAWAEGKNRRIWHLRPSADGSKGGGAVAMPLGIA